MRLLLLLLMILTPLTAQACKDRLRVATFHAELTHKYAGQIAKDLLDPSDAVIAVKDALLTLSPDVVLLTKVDIDAADFVGALLADYLGFPYFYAGPVNRGVSLGFDENRNGREDANDNHGYGKFYGQSAMVLLSKCEISSAYHFNNVKWAEIARDAPAFPSGEPYFHPEEWQEIRLATTAFWQVNILFDNKPLAILASYHTAPVFDGEENRNGLRNRDELAFWQAYIGGTVFEDDDGVSRQLDAPFVLLGNFNLDPENGDGERAFMRDFLESGLVQDPKPRGVLGTATANWDAINAGHMRVDYVLPSPALEILGAGQSATMIVDHYAVYVDIAEPAP